MSCKVDALTTSQEKWCALRSDVERRNGFGPNFYPKQ
jgi:hypothetical protein